MKLIILFLGISVSLLFAESKSGLYEVSGISQNDTLSIKSQPKVKSKKIGELSFNTTGIKVLQCIETKDNRYKQWCQIIINKSNSSEIKWVAKKFLKKSSTNKLKHTSKYIGQEYKVIGHKPHEFLNVRAGTSTNYKILDRLAYDKTGIKISNCFNLNNKKNSRWCWINYKDNQGINKSGWVSAKYLKNNKKSTLGYIVQNKLHSKVADSWSEELSLDDGNAAFLILKPTKNPKMTLTMPQHNPYTWIDPNTKEYDEIMNNSLIIKSKDDYYHLIVGLFWYGSKNYHEMHKALNDAFGKKNVKKIRDLRTYKPFKDDIFELFNPNNEIKKDKYWGFVG